MSESSELDAPVLRTMLDSVRRSALVEKTAPGGFLGWGGERRCFDLAESLMVLG